MRYSSLLTLVSGAAAQSRGFNYGNLDLDGSPRTQQDFEDQFNAAKELPGTNGAFKSARLFTMIQAGTSGDLISAIQAAVDTDTSLLLGLWGSAGQQAFDLELAALQFAIDNFGTDLGSRIVGISIGSEDLYRNSPDGIENESGIGADPDQIVSYIRQVRELIEGTPLADASLGHVDTWTAWVNSSNSAVVEAVDWVGVDAYPYFQSDEANSVEAGADLFFAAYDATVGASQGKPVWVTETGWPVAGPQSNEARTGPSEAEQYWQAVSCRLQSSDTNLWWFTLDDDQATSDDVSFSLVNPADLFGEPLYDLTCGAQDDDDDSTSASRSAATPISTATGAVGTAASASRTPTDTDIAGSTTMTFLGTPTVVPDVTVSTFGGPVVTSAPGAYPNTTHAGNGTVPQTTMPVTYDGSAMRSGVTGGLAAFVIGLAAWIM